MQAVEKTCLWDSSLISTKINFWLHSFRLWMLNVLNIRISWRCWWYPPSMLNILIMSTTTYLTLRSFLVSWISRKWTAYSISHSLLTHCLVVASLILEYERWTRCLIAQANVDSIFLSPILQLVTILSNKNLANPLIHLNLGNPNLKWHNAIMIHLSALIIFV